MIAMLGYSEVDIGISDIGMKTVESNNYREMSEDNGDANRVLATIWKRARLFCKDGWKFISLFTQSISELCWISQLYPRTKEQEELSRVI